MNRLFIKRKVFSLVIAIFAIGFLPVFSQENNTAAQVAFPVPVGFDSDLDSLLYSYYAKNARRGDCKTIGTTNIAYPDSVYQRRLAQLPHEVNMPYNPAVRSFINRYTERGRKQVEYMVGLGNKYYFPMFEDILAKYNVPLEFKYLAVIESALRTTAVSHAGAAGLWQFMPSTGKMYGLEVNTLVDERLDPVKATHAAARYLQDLYRIYKDWHLAIAAYNCGPGNINRAIRRAGGKRDYWSISPFLPAETRSYVPIFIAANYVMTYYAAHNLCPAEINMPTYTDTVRINQRVHFTDITQILNISVEELRVLNPQYRRDIIPGSAEKQYSLSLPNNYAGKFDAKRKLIYAEATRQDSIRRASGNVSDEELTSSSQQQSSQRKIYHKVKSGESLGLIAQRNRVTVTQLKKWNNLRSNSIHPGQRLIIYK